MSAPDALDLVVMIDDDLTDLRLQSRVLKRSGLVREILSFRRAEDALAWFQRPERPEPDIVLLDIRMPRMSGFDFLEALDRILERAHEPPVVVMLTTSLAPDDKARARRYARVRGYLVKPLSQDKLERLLALRTPGSDDAEDDA